MREEITAEAARALLWNKGCCCGADVEVVNNTVWCQAGCTWNRGSGIDFLALHVGGYTQAVKAAAVASPWLETVRDAADMAAWRRQLFEFLLLKGRSDLSVERLAIGHRFAAKWGASGPSFRHLCRTEMLDLMLLLGQLEADIPYGLHGCGGTLVTFWKSPHEPAVFSILPDGAADFQQVLLQPVRYAWSGLDDGCPGLDKVDIYPDAILMEKQRRYYDTALYDRLPVASLSSPASDKKSMTFPDMRFVAPEGNWGRLLPTWSHVPGFEEAGFVTAPEQEKSGLKDILDDLLTEKREALPGILGGMVMSDDLRLWLTAQVRRLPHSALTDDLINSLNRKLLEVDRNTAFFSTLNGYEIERKDKTLAVTNFTVEPLELTGFPSTGEVDYRVMIRMNDRGFECNVPHKALESGNALGAAVVAQQLLLAPELPTARVIRPADASRILGLIRNKDVPRFRGFRTLGWGPRQDEFVMPSCSVTETGETTDTRYIPLFDSDFHPFERRESQWDGQLPDPVTAELVAALVGTSIRAFHGLPLRMVPVLNNEVTRRTCQALFLELGQTSPLRLTAVTQKHLDTLRGFPCLVSNMTETQGRSAVMCGARLAEKGKEITGQGALAGQALAQALKEVARILLRGDTAGFEERRSVSLVNAFALEGRKVLVGLFGEWPEAGEKWKSLDALLETREKEIGGCAHIRFDDDMVVLPKAVWDGFDPNDIAIELGLLCRSVRVESDRIEVDRNTLYPLLEDFYGETPKLELVSP